MTHAATGTINARKLAVERPLSTDVDTIVGNIGCCARHSGVGARLDEIGWSEASIWRPMCPTLECPDAIEAPATDEGSLNSVQVLTRQIIDIVQYQTVPDIEYGIAAVEARVGIIRAVAVAGCRTSGGRCGIMPG